MGLYNIHMLIKEANKIIISLSKPGKMPGFAYGLPAPACKTGAKLVKIPGSVCAGCYALKGNYVRFPEILKAQYKRLKSIDHPLWVAAMARMSSHMVDQGPVKFWPHTSTVTSGQARTCPAPDQGGKCKSCRACWSRKVKNITYGKH